MNEENESPKQMRLDEKLDQAFADKSLDITIWTPLKEGDKILGRILEYDISKEYSTPYLILVDKDNIEKTVFIKMGAISFFRRRRWIAKDETWNTEIMESVIGSLIAFQYCGLKMNPKTDNEFQQYKVLFPSVLEEMGISELE